MSGITATEDTNLMIAQTDLNRRHVIIITMEDVAANTTFELEVIRRIEGIPTDESQSLETRQV